MVTAQDPLCPLRQWAAHLRFPLASPKQPQLRLAPSKVSAVSHVRGAVVSVTVPRESCRRESGPWWPSPGTRLWSRDVVLTHLRAATLPRLLLPPASLLRPWVASGASGTHRGYSLGEANLPPLWLPQRLDRISQLAVPGGLGRLCRPGDGSGLRGQGLGQCRGTSSPAFEVGQARPRSAALAPLGVGSAVQPCGLRLAPHPAAAGPGLGLLPALPSRTLEWFRRRQGQRGISGSDTPLLLARR